MLKSLLIDMFKKNTGFICFIFLTFLFVYFSVFFIFDFSSEVYGNALDYYSYYPDILTYAFKTPIWGDGYGHYVYLPSVFIYHNFNLDFIRTDAYQLTSIGKVFMKYPIGTSVLMSPFFLFAHFLTKITNIQEANGFSIIYQIFVFISTFVYWLIGIICSYKIFLKFVNKNIALLTCIFITYGCGMFYYLAFAPGYSHIYSFCLTSILLLQILNEKKLDKQYAIKLGIIYGIIFLLRNLNILTILLLVFYKVDSLSGLKSRIKKILNFNFSFPFLLSFLIIIIPQILYWYNQTNHIIVNSYTIAASETSGDYFDWLTPHFIRNLFSSCGLIVCYPITVLSFMGIFLINKMEKLKQSKIALLSTFFIFLYFVSAWHIWWYGFSFGQRLYIDIMPIFGILLCSTFEFISKLKNKYMRNFIYLISILLVAFSIYKMVTMHLETYNFIFENNMYM